ncbi:MAG: hypothetical protein JNJ63_11210 [Hyphomonadaceae bacterium]|nr:hypothetical protein [Hyphomonadaceae bacterium]
MKLGEWLDELGLGFTALGALLALALLTAAEHQARAQVQRHDGEGGDGRSAQRR